MLHCPVLASAAVALVSNHVNKTASSSKTPRTNADAHFTATRRQSRFSTRAWLGAPSKKVHHVALRPHSLAQIQPQSPKILTTTTPPTYGWLCDDLMYCVYVFSIIAAPLFQAPHLERLGGLPVARGAKNAKMVPPPRDLTDWSHGGDSRTHFGANDYQGVEMFIFL